MEESLGRRLELNRARAACDYVHHHRILHPAHGAESMAVGGGHAVFATPYGAPSLSKAFAVGLGCSVTDDDLDELAAFYARHRAPPKITVCPWTDPSLFGRLARRGYGIIQFDSVLARPIDRIVGERRVLPQAVAVRRVTTAEVPVWGDLLRQGMETATDDVERSRATEAVFPLTSHFDAFIATLDGRPAGAAGLLLYDGVATLFATSTLPEYRRRGVQGALVAARLAHARHAGADVAMVLTWAGSASQRNLENNYGFRVGFTALVLSPEISSP